MLPSRFPRLLMPALCFRRPLHSEPACHTYTYLPGTPADRQAGQKVLLPVAGLRVGV